MNRCLAVFGLALLALVAMTRCAQACGTERWPPKVLTDADASNINPVPEDTTIQKLYALTPPSSLPPDLRVGPVEYTVYRLRNVDLFWMHTSTDQDYHMEVEDAGGRTMITESPDPACLGTLFSDQTSAVHKVIDEHYTVTSNGPRPNVPVTITGVAFFDFILGQSVNPGEADNAIELHPLLSICFGVNCSPISVSPAQAKLDVGASTTLTASEEFYSGSFSATSSDTSIATVTPDGPGKFDVTAQAQGTATITIGDQHFNSQTVTIDAGQFVKPGSESWEYEPSAIAASSSAFYTIGESGGVSLEMDPVANGPLTYQTLTYAGNSNGPNFGWVTAAGQPEATSWPAQQYEVDLNVRVPNSNLSITEVKILRVDSAGGPNTSGLATVGDSKGLSQSLGATGILHFYVNGNAQHAAAGDRMAVKFYVRNSSASSQSFAYGAGDSTFCLLTGSAGKASTPTPAPTPAPTPTPMPTPSPTPTPTATPSPAPSATPLPTPPATAAWSFAPSSIATVTTPFYGYRETGNLATELDYVAGGPPTNETISYQGNSSGSNFGWVTPSGVPGATSWPAQTYDVALNVTQPNANLAITEVKILRVDASGGPSTAGLATIADLKAISRSLSSSGVLHFALIGRAQSASGTDRLAVKFYLHNSASTTQSFAYDAGTSTLSNVSGSSGATPMPTATPKPAPVPAGGWSFAPSSIAAATKPFYIYEETGDLAAELDYVAGGSSTDETISYQGNHSGSNFGWLTPAGVPGSASWPAQSYDIALDVTNANPNLEVTEVKILRVDASGGPSTSGLATVADSGAISQPLSVAGVLHFSLIGKAQSASSGDRLAVKFYLRNLSSTEQSFTYNAGASTLSNIAGSAGATPAPAPSATPIPSPNPNVTPAALRLVNV